MLDGTLPVEYAHSYKGKVKLVIQFRVINRWVETLGHYGGSEMKKVGLEVMTKYHWHICSLHIIRSDCQTVSAATEDNVQVSIQ